MGKTRKAIQKWMEEQWQSTPARVTPIMCMDLNTQLTQKHEQYDLIGPYGTTQNTGKVTPTGHAMMKFMRKQVIEAVNTNGAGDMFAGAFLYALSRGETDLRATKYATLAAGEVVKYSGPRLKRDACLTLRRQFFGD